MSSLSLRLAERKTILILTDLFIINLSTIIAFWIHATRTYETVNWEIARESLIWFLFLSGLWLISAYFNGFYKTQQLTELVKALPALLGTVSLIFVVYIVIFFYFAPRNILPRGLVLYQGVISFVLIGLWRAVYSVLAHRPGFGRRVIIVGAGWAGKTIAHAIHENAEYHYQIVGFVDDEPEKQNSIVYLDSDNHSGSENHKNNYELSENATLSVLGSSENLVTLVKAQRVSEVILAVTHDINSSLFQAILDAKELGVQITHMPVLYEQLTGRVPIEHIGDNWYVALPLDSADSSGFYLVANRLFDITSSLIGLLLLLPFLPFVALLIYIDSPGPIFYSQERVGKGGEIFNLIKLRTMIPEAEKGGAERARVSDERITRIGRLLRKIRLDEMPQLLNVLKGEMSAVGPRPERPEHLAELDEEIPFHRLRNSAKPGMAGWAVVNYGYIESLEDAKIRLQYDLYYVKHQSIWLDITILLRTFLQMILLKGR